MLTVTFHIYIYSLFITHEDAILNINFEQSVVFQQTTKYAVFTRPNAHYCVRTKDHWAVFRAARTSSHQVPLKSVYYLNTLSCVSSRGIPTKFL